MQSPTKAAHRGGGCLYRTRFVECGDLSLAACVRECVRECVRVRVRVLTVRICSSVKFMPWKPPIYGDLQPSLPLPAWPPSAVDKHDQLLRFSYLHHHAPTSYSPPSSHPVSTSRAVSSFVSCGFIIVISLQCSYYTCIIVFYLKIIMLDICTNNEIAYKISLYRYINLI